MILRAGCGEVARWKEPWDWPLGGSKGDRETLVGILVGRACDSLREADTLAWGPIP